MRACSGPGKLLCGDARWAPDMCRMLATVGSYDEAAPLFARFHRDAAEGATLPDHVRGHRDGWGIVKGAAYLGRSARDAFDDPAYAAAAARVAGPGRGVATAG